MRLDPRRLTRLSSVSLMAALILRAPVGAHPAGAGTPTFAPASPVSVTRTNRHRIGSELPTGRLVTPVGTIVGTPNFPTGLAIGPSGWVFVLANGATPFETLSAWSATLVPKSQLAALHGGLPRTTRRIFVGLSGGGTGLDLSRPDASVKIYDPAQSNRQKRVWTERALRLARAHGAAFRVTVIPHQNLFQGVLRGPGGLIYATGGESDNVVAIRMLRGHLSIVRRYPLSWQPFPSSQYPFQYQGNPKGTHHFYPDGLTLGPRGHHLYVTGLLANSLAKIDLATGMTRYLNVGPYPFSVVQSGGDRLVVSDWGGAGVTVVDPRTWRVKGSIATGSGTRPGGTRAGVHPTALAPVPGTPDVWVADSNIDRIVEIDSQTLKVVRILLDNPYRGAPPGSYPDALAVLGNRLYVANAGNDDVAVFDPASGAQLGLIPTGWYPTALAIDRGMLYMASAKGLGSGANPDFEWDGAMMDGLLEKVPLGGLKTALPRWTARTLRDDGFSRVQRMHRRRSDRHIAAYLHRHIHYVVFILRENKTFDEDLGDDRAAGRFADPHLDLYGPKELPNLYRFAHEETLFVNFMADGEVTSQGHQWTTGASDSDWVQRTWPISYGGRGLHTSPGWTSALAPLPTNPYADFENLDALGPWSNPWVSYPARLFLFNDLLAHGVSFEDMGEFVSRSESGNISPAMQRHIAMDYPGWDRMILDTERAQRAIGWLKKHPGARFPHFLYIWLPDDHTAGLSPCYYTPDYYVANNDHATAEVVHYLSTLPEWRHMVVFITEDDAQSGADHINAHRTFALAISPWVKRHHLETHLYSQVNIVKTTEAVFGLTPLSQWDQNARVFRGIWTRHPDFASIPVAPLTTPLRFNPGHCTNQLLLRREAGATGHVYSRHWFRAHQSGQGAARLPQADRYSPTTLLKVSGPEQMRQEWIGSKGLRSYEETLHYLRAFAQKHDAPVGAYEGGAHF
ncbi:MAG: bifunctional YncE family protein/alkaline phosphatase family protein [Gammaproteobacteria bacterium]